MPEQNSTPLTQADISKQKSRFEKIEKKIDALFDLMDKFEKKNGEVDDLSNWLNSLLGNQKQIEELTQNFTGLVDENTKTVEDNVEKVESLFSQASEANNEITQLKDACGKSSKQIEDIESRIQNILNEAEKALTSATAAGLAKEFETRRKDLFNTQIGWVIGLAVSLILALVIAYVRFNAIQELLNKPNPITGSVLILNCLISFLSIAAPVWFAWVSTKQIGYCFRLSEDYGFKASIAAAYEGFRKEIEKLPHDDDSEIEEALRGKLLDSILKSLDERPLRYVEEKVSGSPFHEILNSHRNKVSQPKEE